MSSNIPKVYKKYLEPDSDDPVPSSSWYRYKKLCAEKDKPDSSPGIEGGQEYVMKTDENLEHAEPSHDPHFTEYESIGGFEPFVHDGSTTVDENSDVFNVIQSLAEDIDSIENEIKHSITETNFKARRCKAYCVEKLI